MPHDPMAFYSSRTRVAKSGQWNCRKRVLWFALGVASVTTFMLIAQRWPW